MPRGTDGTYSLPNGTLVSSGDTILVSQHNPAMSDIATALTGSLPRNGSGGMLAALPMGANKITNLAPGTDPTDAATVSQLSSGSSVPVGSIVDYAGASAPTGWLVCGGQSLSRTTYAELFAVIGTTFGSADASSFSLPDLRGRVAAGLDFSVSGIAGRLTGTTMTPGGTTLGATGGAQTQTLTEAQMPSHTHTGSTTTDGAHTHTTLAGSSTAVASAPGVFATDADGGVTGSGGAHDHDMDLDDTGGGEAHPNVQPTIILNKIMKVVS